MKKSYGYILKYLSLVTLVAYSCGGRQNPSQEMNLNHRNGTEYATHFTIDELKGCTRITVINPWQKSDGIKLEYYLVRSGSIPPDDIDQSSVIMVPVKNVILMSTTYIPIITTLGMENAISGISGADFVYDTLIRKRFSEGFLPDVGYGENLNKELILNISPDLIIAYGIGSENSGYLSRLKELGIKVFFNADYLEELPLGRAEWIKVFGALFCLEKAADSLLNAVKAEYIEVRDYISGRIDSRPSVMLGLPWRDSWFVSPGNSYISNMISDAGGNYIWKEMKADYSVPLGIENVFAAASNADYWLNAGNAENINSIISLDGRLAFLKPVKSGNVYNNNRRISPGGGNDYWESGSILPGIILKDIASILHPDLFYGYEPKFYKKLE